MQLQVLKSNGTYQPLDVYDDFKIEYTHEYDDYSELSSRKIPYTDKFKVPLSVRNRELLGIPFDVTYPKNYEVEGRVTNNDTDVVFYCVYEVNKQVTNILEPYIEITLVDKISSAIKKLNTTEFWEILTGAGTKFGLYESWPFNAPNNVGYPNTAPFVFPFFNFNNKLMTFAYDPMRNLNQLQPAWIVSHLIKMIFNSVGVQINSKFLFETNGIFQGITYEELALMLPTSFFNSDPSAFSAKARILYNTAPYKGLPLLTDMSAEAPFQMPVSMPLELENFNSFIPDGGSQKMNWNSYDFFSPSLNRNVTGVEFCSMVDGKLHLRATKVGIASTPRAFFGTMVGTELTDYTLLDETQPLVLPDLQVRLVGLTEVEMGENPLIEQNQTAYDLAKSIVIGEAKYVGITNASHQQNTYPYITYDLLLYDEISGDFEVFANQRLNFGLVLTQKEGVDFGTAVDIPIRWKGDGTGKNQCSGNIEVKDGFMYIKDFDDTNFSPYFMYSCFSGTENFPINFEFSFNEATEFQPVTDYAFKTNGRDRPDALIDLQYSYKMNKDKIKLIDIVKAVMQRFNLSMYTGVDGQIYIDSHENRVNGDIIIDHLIDEQIAVNYTKDEYGILSIEDENPNFYADGYNSLKDYVFNKDLKDSQKLSMGSAIVNPKMFEDVYDDYAYDLLRAVNDSNFWGTSNRKQEPISELKPTFCFLNSGAVDVRFPINGNFKNIPQTDEVIALGDGFFNYFREQTDQSGLYKQKSIATDTLQGYSLLSFVDNDIIDGNTSYIWCWQRSVKILMDNDTVNVEMDIFISPETFSKLISFPVIKYYGANWELLGLDNYPISAQNGGVVTIKMALIEDSVAPPDPTVLKPVWLLNTSFDTPEGACNSLAGYTKKYHNGVGTLPDYNDKFFNTNNTTTPFNGLNRHWKIQGESNAIKIDTYGVLEARYACSGVPPVTYKPISVSTNKTDSINPCTTTYATTTRWHNGAGQYPVNGDIIYINYTGTTPFNGGGNEYGIPQNKSYFNVSSSGVVSLVTYCPIRVEIDNTAYTSASTACGDSFSNTSIMWIPPKGGSQEMAVGDVLYTQSTLGSVWNGQNKYWKTDRGTSILVNTVGIIQSITNC